MTLSLRPQPETTPQQIKLPPADSPHPPLRSWSWRRKRHRAPDGLWTGCRGSQPVTAEQRMWGRRRDRGGRSSEKRSCKTDRRFSGCGWTNPDRLRQNPVSATNLGQPNLSGVVMTDYLLIKNDNNNKVVKSLLKVIIQFICDYVYSCAVERRGGGRRRRRWRWSKKIVTKLQQPNGWLPSRKVRADTGRDTAVLLVKAVVPKLRSCSFTRIEKLINRK